MGTRDIRVGARSDGKWPCQRLRVGYGLILFFFFEVFIAKRLPEVMPAIALGAGIACVASALFAIREWKLALQIELIQDALDRRTEAWSRS